MSRALCERLHGRGELVEEAAFRGGRIASVRARASRLCEGVPGRRGGHVRGRDGAIVARRVWYLATSARSRFGSCLHGLLGLQRASPEKMRPVGRRRVPSRRARIGGMAERTQHGGHSIRRRRPACADWARRRRYGSSPSLALVLATADGLGRDSADGGGVGGAIASFAFREKRATRLLATAVTGAAVSIAAGLLTKLEPIGHVVVFYTRRSTPEVWEPVARAAGTGDCPSGRELARALAATAIASLSVFCPLGRSGDRARRKNAAAMVSLPRAMDGGQYRCWARATAGVVAARGWRSERMKEGRAAFCLMSGSDSPALSGSERRCMCPLPGLVSGDMGSAGRARWMAPCRQPGRGIPAKGRRS